jgi:hypothetical protein
MFCRTFPFTFGIVDEDNNNTKNGIQISYTEKGKKYCPGISDESPQINIEKWNKLGKLTLKELVKNYKLTKDWNNKVKKGKIIPTVKKLLLTIFNLESS